MPLTARFTACFVSAWSMLFDSEKPSSTLSVLPRLHETADIGKFVVCMHAPFSHMQTMAVQRLRILSVLQISQGARACHLRRRHAGHGCVAAKQRQGLQELHVDLQGEEGQAFGKPFACQTRCLLCLTRFCLAD